GRRLAGRIRDRRSDEARAGACERGRRFVGAVRRRACGTPAALARETTDASTHAPAEAGVVVALPIILAACAIGGVSAQCGTLTVPENRAEPAGRQIDLAVAVVPATDRTRRRADPVFWISGGPGGVAQQDLKWVVPTFASTVLQDHDMVFVDQRGVGSS